MRNSLKHLLDTDQLDVSRGPYSGAASKNRFAIEVLFISRKEILVESDKASRFQSRDQDSVFLFQDNHFNKLIR